MLFLVRRLRVLSFTKTASGGDEPFAVDVVCRLVHLPATENVASRRVLLFEKRTRLGTRPSMGDHSYCQQVVSQRDFFMLEGASILI